MTFEEMTAQVLQLPLSELRAKEADYLEAVIVKIHWQSLGTILQNYFGPALKPAGTEASDEVNQLTAEHGGISENQTLYYKKSAQTAELAMLWPWGNGTSLTAKMVREAL